MEGQLVVVEPLASQHEEGLFAAGHDRETWAYLSASPDAYETRERFHRWMDESLAATAAGDGVPGRSSTAPADGRSEARATSRFAPSTGRSRSAGPGSGPGGGLAQRRDEAPLARSGVRAARLRAGRAQVQRPLACGDGGVLPAQFEGIHRRHRRLPGGGWRDTAWYSVSAPGVAAGARRPAHAAGEARRHRLRRGVRRSAGDVTVFPVPKTWSGM